MTDEPVSASTDETDGNRGRHDGAAPEPRKRRLPDVLYEDDALLAFDKPSGLLAVPDRWDKRADNLIRMIHTRIAPGIFNAHRLDRDTSGVFLCAKTREALKKLVADFQDRRVEKRYLALVTGVPRWDEERVDVPVLPDPHQPGRMRAVAFGDQAAVTRLRVLQRWRGYALVEALPLTGRTHQIRVHLAHVGFPLVGDPLYSRGTGLYLSTLKRGYKHKAEPERPLIGRTALHAESLSLTHPVTGAALVIRAPVPKDLAVAVKYLDRFAA